MSHSITMQSLKHTERKVHSSEKDIGIYQGFIAELHSN